jgi:hypothetical protein
MGKGTLRNKDCYCGSGKKYKKCHLMADEGWVATPSGFRSQEQMARERLMEMLKEQREKVKKTREEGKETIELDQPIENITPIQDTTPPVPPAPIVPPTLGVSVQEVVKTHDKFGG